MYFAQAEADDLDAISISVDEKLQEATKLQAKSAVLISPVFPPNVANGGGVAITYGELAKRLPAKGCSVTVLSPNVGNLDAYCTRWYPTFRTIYPSFSTLRSVWDGIRDNDVVVCPDNTILPFILVFGAIHATPVMYNIHTNVPHLLTAVGAPPIVAWFVLTLFQVCSWFAQVCFTTSPSSQQLLEDHGYCISGVFSPRIKVAVFENKDDVPETIAAARQWLCADNKTEAEAEEARAAAAARTRQPVLLYAGRWSKEKRISLLVAAKPAHCVLAIVGDGPIGDDLETLHNPAEGVLVHRGIVDQARLRVLYKAADLHVSASDFETLGMTVMESHLCGTPVVVQHGPGFVTQVVRGENGYLVDYADAAAARRQITEALESDHITAERVLKTSAQRWDALFGDLDDLVINMGQRRRLWRNLNCFGALLLSPLVLTLWLALLFSLKALRIGTVYPKKKD